MEKSKKEKKVKKDDKATCLACSCPCDAHKEHNHPVENSCCGGCK